MPEGWKREPVPRSWFSRRLRGGGFVHIVDWGSTSYVVSGPRTRSDKLTQVMTATPIEAACRVAEALADTAGGWARNGDG